MTCKDCLCCKVCDMQRITLYNTSRSVCEYFKDKSQYIKLPCKVGDTVYELQSDGTIQKWLSYGITKYDGQEWAVQVKNNKNKWRYVDRTFGFSRFGKTVFLDKGSAKKALREREEK